MAPAGAGAAPQAAAAGIDLAATPSGGSKADGGKGKPESKAQERRRALLREMCDRVAEMMEKPHEANWTAPWSKGGEYLPCNPTTGREYRGSNWYLMQLTASMKGYPTGSWAGYNQWKKAGCAVREGEKGFPVFYPRQFPCCKDKGCKNGSICGGTGGVGFGVSTVFNAAQLDTSKGEPPPHPKAGQKVMGDADVATAREQAEILDRLGADIKVGGDSAFYDFRGDAITMPEVEKFHSPEAYLSTLAHEHVHWTGHESRLDRDLKGLSSDPDSYAREELVAEMGAAMLSAVAGFENERRDDHAAYLAHWAEKLKGEDGPTILDKAMKDADKAVSWIMEESGMSEDGGKNKRESELVAA